MNQELEIKILRELNTMLRGGKYIALSLSPGIGHSTIEPEGNRMFINEGRDGKYEGVSEAFYDLAVKRFDTRK